MTDFLTTLATRTLGLTPVMQPLIASIFTAGEYDSFGVDLVRSHEIPSISQAQSENSVFNSNDTQRLTSNQQTAASEIKSTLVNPDQITETVNKQIDSIPEIDAITTLVPHDVTAEIPSNDTQRLTNNQQTAASEIKSTLVNPDQITETKQINSIPAIDEITTLVPQDVTAQIPSNDTQRLTSNQQTPASEIKSTLVNPDQITETVTQQIDSIPEIDEITTLVPQDVIEEIPSNDTQRLTSNQQTPASEIKSTLVNPDQITKTVNKQIDSIPAINEITTLFPQDVIAAEITRNNQEKISQLDSTQRQPNSQSEIKSSLINSQKAIPIPVESLNNKDKTNSLDSILIPHNPKPQNIEPSNVVISPNSIPSASLSQTTASTIKPVVMTHPSAIYPQMELESRQLERINQRENVPATPTPTITVSIGRIEVRASPQSTPPKTHKSTRKEPGLSLQDYLKQRQGGK